MDEAETGGKVTVIIEISRPFQICPGSYNSEVVFRVWWLFFSITFLKVSLREFSETSYTWEVG